MVELAVPLFIIIVVANIVISIVRTAKDVSDKYQGKPTPKRTGNRLLEPDEHDRLNDPDCRHYPENRFNSFND